MGNKRWFDHVWFRALLWILVMIIVLCLYMSRAHAQEEMQLQCWQEIDPQTGEVYTVCWCIASEPFSNV